MPAHNHFTNHRSGAAKPESAALIPPFAKFLGKSFIRVGSSVPSAVGDGSRRSQLYTLDLIYVGLEKGVLTYKGNFIELPPPMTGTGWCLHEFRLIDGLQAGEMIPAPALPCSLLRCSLHGHLPKSPAAAKSVKVMHPELRRWIFLHSLTHNSIL